MKYAIHKRILVRLLLVWAVLSIIISAAVYAVEMRRVDEFVISLATAESARISDAYRAYYYDQSPERLSRLSVKVRQELKRMHFLLIEIYSQDKDRIVLDTLQDLDNEILAVEEREHEHLMGDRPHLDKLRMAGRLYLKIVVPITDEKEQNVIGYFEGVYRVEKATLSVIRSRIATSIVQVVVVLFLTAAVLYPVIFGMQKDLLKLSRDLLAANIGMLKALGGAIAKRDSETHLHNYRVTIYAIRLAEALGITGRSMQGLIKGAFLHDIGKIGISDAVLLKRGDYSKEDVDDMQSHVRHGVDILKSLAWFRDAVDVVGFHHERFDGSGYAAGLQGPLIPLATRIFTVVDVFDALTSKRPYKERFSFERALEIMQEGRGKLFDPDVLDAFLALAGQLYEEINPVTEEDLERQMNSLVDKYFINV